MREMEGGGAVEERDGRERRRSIKKDLTSMGGAMKGPEWSRAYLDIFFSHKKKIKKSRVIPPISKAF